MTGTDIEFTGSLAMNSISFYGLPTISVGTVNPPEGDDSYEVATALDEKKKSYRKLVFKNDKMVGYVLVGDIDMAGMYTAFVKFQMAVLRMPRSKSLPVSLMCSCGLTISSKRPGTPVGKSRIRERI